MDHSVGGGCDLRGISNDGTLIACIDGGRHVHIVTENGVKRGRFSSGELIGLSVANDGTGIAVNDDEGHVYVLDSNGNLRWKRSPYKMMAK
ncbi:MAG: hypothetical protein Ct9H90mP16_09390 [Candidatus Poseidoniales archaeon]|nr:MAG: hypothetical protein Ct9H90mP16_09390 [Candidatus Poseidoniales archaeon]